VNEHSAAIYRLLVESPVYAQQITRAAFACEPEQALREAAQLEWQRRMAETDQQLAGRIALDLVEWQLVADTWIDKLRSSKAAGVPIGAA
jgi:hypothetical protein